MSVRLNKEHPAYNEYKRKWDELTARHDKEVEAYGPSHMKDGLVNPVLKRQASELKALQAEYAFLFDTVEG